MSNANSTLTAERLRELVHYNPETGIFTRLCNSSKRAHKGTVAGCKSALGYIVFRVDKVLHYAHRLAVLYMTGAWPPELVDHIDMDRSNNRWANLRMAIKSENMQNVRSAQKNSRSGLLGAHWSSDHNAWRACISINGKVHRVGLHATAEEAHAAYLDLKRKHHPFGTL